MKMQEIKKIAQNWDVDTRIGRSKAAVIRDIQVREGFSPCYGTKEICDENNCLWREDCLSN